MDDEELNQLFGMDEDGSSEPEQDGLTEPDVDKGEEDAAEEGGVFVMSAEEDEDGHEAEIADEPHSESKDRKNKKNRKSRKDKKKPHKQDEHKEERKPEWFEEDDEVAEADASADPDEYDEEEQYDAPEEEAPVNRPKAPERTVHFHINIKLVLLCLFAMLVIAGIVLVFTLDSFKILKINVEGNYVFSSEELIELSEIEYGEHLFFANYSKAASAIKNSSTYIRDCRVSFTFPSTVNITVEERSKIAYVRTPDGYAALDDQGVVLELSSFDSNHKVAPVISGLNITHASLGKEIVIGNYSDYQKAIIVLGSLIAADTNDQNGSYQIFENTEEVRVLPSGYIFLTIRLPNNNLLQVKFDSLEKISTQTAWLLYAIDSQVFEHGFATGSLDMTRDEPIYRQFVVNSDSDAGSDDGDAESSEDN